MIAPHPALIELAAGRGLPPVTDPMPMVRSALAHGMAGLLLSAVEETDRQSRLVVGLLRARQTSTEEWHQKLWSTLGSTVAILDEIGVEVAVAKGIAAEARWYSRVGERPCSDLDLLISPADLGRIDDIIAAVEPSHPLLGKARTLAERGFLSSIDLELDGVPIDLHWDIFKMGVTSRNRHAIWDRTVAFPLPDGGATRALDPETSFVHFLVHLNKDRFRRLLGFADVARVQDQEELDAGAVDRLVRVDGLTTSVNGSWNVVVDTLGLTAPKRPMRPGLRTAVWRATWRPSVRLRGTQSRMQFRHREHLIAVLIPGRTMEALYWWLRRRFPPGELLAAMYSGYAQRAGFQAVITDERSRLWVLTAGRVKAWLVRRRNASALPRR